MRTPAPDLDCELDPGRVASTAGRLQARIEARLPGAGLARTAGSLHRLALAAGEDVARLVQPNWWVRAALVATGVISVGVAAGVWPQELAGGSGPLAPGQLLELLEAGANLAVMAGGAVWSLLALEGRLKRAAALQALHKVRGLIHVIDMRQLTKDPSMLGAPVTDQSPERPLDRFGLERYLDYCSELLALAAKVAALYGQALDDQALRETAGDIEQLATNLSQKIWQKIAILEMGLHDPSPG